MARIKARLSMFLTVNENERRLLKAGLLKEHLNQPDTIAARQLAGQLANMDTLERDFRSQIESVNSYKGTFEDTSVPQPYPQPYTG